jgi:hypothetical protein
MTQNGTLPDAIGDLELLRILYLDSNHFIGSFPASITQLSNLGKTFWRFEDYQVILVLTLFRDRVPILVWKWAQWVTATKLGRHDKTQTVTARFERTFGNCAVPAWIPLDSR